MHPCRIESEDPGCFALRCAAHTFQLLLKDIEDTPLVRGAVQTAENVIEKMEDRELQIKLKDLQKAAGKGEGKLPIKSVDTRY